MTSSLTQPVSRKLQKRTTTRSCYMSNIIQLTCYYDFEASFVMASTGSSCCCCGCCCVVFVCLLFFPLNMLQCKHDGKILDTKESDQVKVKGFESSVNVFFFSIMYILNAGTFCKENSVCWYIISHLVYLVLCRNRCCPVQGHRVQIFKCGCFISSAV